MTLLDLLDVYNGSDGEATKRLYARLQTFGPIGLVAVNMFRAQKCSARAKVYRGGTGGTSYRDEAYRRKQWSMDNLCAVLGEYAASLEVRWGWKMDPEQEYHRWVLYIDLPTGQVSYHTSVRGVGPDYVGNWDGLREMAVTRILKWIEQLFVDDGARRTA